MKRWVCVVVVTAAIACNKKPEPAGEPPTVPAATAEAGIAVVADGPVAAAVDAAAASSPDAAASTERPEVRARALVEKQLAALPKPRGFEADNAAMASLFTKDAVVLTPDGGAVADSKLAELVARMTPHAVLDTKKLNKVVAGGNDAIVWLAAELEVATTAGEQGEPKAIKRKKVVRSLQLLDAAADWKVVAASFGDVRSVGQLPPDITVSMPAPTSPGPLSKLLASPGDVAAALSADPAVVVQGTDPGEYAIGPEAAKALLGKWSKLKLELEPGGQLREVRTKDWGYAMAGVNLAKPGEVSYRMTALIIAVPIGDKWSVVGLHYLPL